MLWRKYEIRYYGGKFGGKYEIDIGGNQLQEEI
jgi:hypothetical protein